VIAVSAAGSQVAIRVTDTGIGLPRDMFDRVFEMFTQVDTSLDRSRLRARPRIAQPCG
jgi:two-component system, chemotaxis family, CheB/CheR fusion protein